MKLREGLGVAAIWMALCLADPLTGRSADQTSSPQTPPARADAAITGVVIDGATKDAIQDAVVQLWIETDRRREVQTELSDAKGRFAFTNLPAADYTITVSKSGYVNEAFRGSGVNVPARHTIRLADGEWFKNAAVSLVKPGSISGRVIDERGEPVIGVYVRVLLATRVAGQDHYAVGQLTTTDDRGVYRISMLMPGRYIAMVPSVQASAPASVPAAILQGMTPQSIAAAQAAGRALPVGDPMIDIDQSTRVGIGGYPIPPPSTNGRAFTYAPTFAGGTSLAAATAVMLDSGMDRTGVDVRLEPVPAIRIAGKVQGPPEAIAGLSLRLLAEGAEDLGTGGETGTAYVDQDGSFVFANVPAGRYTIEAAISTNSYISGFSSLSMFYGAQLPRTPGPGGTSTMSGPALGGPDGVSFSTSTQMGGRKFWGRASVTAARDVSDIVLAVTAAGSISGRLVAAADPSQPKPADDPRYVNLETATGAPWLGSPRSVYNRTASPGKFVIDGVLPGLYQFRSESSGWMLKSVIVDGREYAYKPFDTTNSQTFSGVVVTVTNAVQSLTGTMRDATGAIVTDGAVILFPVEADQWINYGVSPPRIKWTHTSSAGTFRVSSLPAGDYFAIAVRDTKALAWQEPGFFARVQGQATRLTIGWGEKKTQNLQIVDVR